MLCNLCHTWLGNPCRVCRTESRICFLIRSGRITPVHEELVLNVLRNTAGVLSDLVEAGAGLGVANPGAGSTEDLRPPKTEEAQVGEESQRDPEPDEEEKPPKDSKRKKDPKDKKERKAKKVKPVDKDEEEEEGNPLGEKEVAPEERDALKEVKAEPGKEKEETAEEAAARLSAEADAYVKKYPLKVGLGTLAARGSTSGASGSREGVVGGNTKPPEPDGPPPGYHGEELPRRRFQRRGRSRSRKRGTKGAGHRERGHRWKQYWGDQPYR